MVLNGTPYELSPLALGGSGGTSLSIRRARTVPLQFTSDRCQLNPVEPLPYRDKTPMVLPEPPHGLATPTLSRVVNLVTTDSTLRIVQLSHPRIPIPPQ